MTFSVTESWLKCMLRTYGRIASGAAFISDYARLGIISQRLVNVEGTVLDRSQYLIDDILIQKRSIENGTIIYEKAVGTYDNELGFVLILLIADDSVSRQAQKLVKLLRRLIRALSGFPEQADDQEMVKTITILDQPLPASTFGQSNLATVQHVDFPAVKSAKGQRSDGRKSATSSQPSASQKQLTEFMDIREAPQEIVTETAGEKLRDVADTVQQILDQREEIETKQNYEVAVGEVEHEVTHEEAPVEVGEVVEEFQPPEAFDPNQLGSMIQNANTEDNK